VGQLLTVRTIAKHKSLLFLRGTVTFGSNGSYSSFSVAATDAFATVSAASVAIAATATVASAASKLFHHLMMSPLLDLPPGTIPGHEQVCAEYCARRIVV